LAREEGRARRRDRMKGAIEEGSEAQNFLGADMVGSGSVAVDGWAKNPRRRRAQHDRERKK